MAMLIIADRTNRQALHGVHGLPMYTIICAGGNRNARDFKLLHQRGSLSMGIWLLRNQDTRGRGRRWVATQHTDGGENLHHNVERRVYEKREAETMEQGWERRCMTSLCAPQVSRSCVHTAILLCQEGMQAMHTIMCQLISADALLPGNKYTSTPDLQPLKNIFRPLCLGGSPTERHPPPLAPPSHPHLPPPPLRSYSSSSLSSCLSS